MVSTMSKRKPFLSGTLFFMARIRSGYSWGNLRTIIFKFDVLAPNLSQTFSNYQLVFDTSDESPLKMLYFGKAKIEIVSTV